MDFLRNLLRLTRPLSNIKNIALILFAFYLSGADFNLKIILLGIISLSLVQSSIYAYNSLNDQETDRKNPEKNHYFQAVQYFGSRKIFFIILFLIVSGFIAGLAINIYFVFSLVALLIVNFLYSSKYTRFKEKILLDIFSGGALGFLIRFIASWFIFKISFPPILALLSLFSVKTAGYLLYKELDRGALNVLNIKNSITAVSKKTIIVISTVLFSLALFSFILMCLNQRYFQLNYLGILPFRFLILLPFAILPIIVIYLSVFKKINIKVWELRVLGLIFLLLLTIIIWRLL